MKVVLNFEGELPAALNAFKNTVFAEDAESGPTAAIRSPDIARFPSNAGITSPPKASIRSAAIATAAWA